MHPESPTSSVINDSQSPLYMPENKSSLIKVAVRVRPAPIAEDCIWSASKEARIEFTRQFMQSRPKRKIELNQYDYTYLGSDNKILFENVAKDAVTNCMKGLNTVIFAYGQTSSGKTYAMMGNESQPGIIPQAIDHVFNYIRGHPSGNAEYLLRFSYLEIFNETIRDLLNPEQTGLKIVESSTRGVYVMPLKEEIITDPVQVMTIIKRGESNRHISATVSNSESSRSHTILQLIIERTTSNGHIIVSQLNLIDLAGSERGSSDSERTKEGGYINRSLLTLSTVISRLTDTLNEDHLPFRDSKLTRFLQPALMGKSQISVIATISPFEKNVDESIHTLKFATRVSSLIVNPQPLATMENEKVLLQIYKKEVESLKEQLKQTQASQLAAKHEMTNDERKQYKDRIAYLARLIITNNSVTTKSLLDWNASSLNDNSVMLVDGLLPSLPLKSDAQEDLPNQSTSSLQTSQKLNTSMPQLFTPSRRGSIDATDLDVKKAKMLYTFIKSLKKVEDKEEMASKVSEFQLDMFVNSKLCISDLKTEAALKKIETLKEEKKHMEVVLEEHTNQIATLQRQLVQTREEQGNVEHSHDEIHHIAQEQQDIIESLQKKVKKLQIELQESKSSRSVIEKPAPGLTIGKELYDTLKNIKLLLTEPSNEELADLLACCSVRPPSQFL